MVAVKAYQKILGVPLVRKNIYLQSALAKFLPGSEIYASDYCIRVIVQALANR
jgi:hypothetical protein